MTVPSAAVYLPNGMMTKARRVDIGSLRFDRAGYSDDRF